MQFFKQLKMLTCYRTICCYSPILLLSMQKTRYMFAEIARYADGIKVLFHQIPIIFGRQRQNEITFVRQLYI